MSEWQTIETAPKDVEVIVFDPTNRPSVFTAEFCVHSGWCCSVEGRYAPEDDFFGDSLKAPTHWMPLPSPPSD